MILAVSCALQPEAGSALQMLKLVVKEYCFVKNTSFDDLKDLHGHVTGSALSRNVNLVLANPPCNTRSARDLASSAPDSLCKREHREGFEGHEQRDGS